MGGLEFVASIVGSLAWPVVVVVLIILLKEPISKLLTSRPMKRIKAGPGGLEIEYVDQVLADARQELDAAKAEKPELDASAGTIDADARSGADDFMEEMTQLAAVAPTAAVLESYARLERVLRQALDLPTTERPRPMGGVRGLGREAVERGLLAASELAALNDVTILRNVVAHGGPADLGMDRALEYVSIIRQLIISMELAQGRTIRDGWPAGPAPSST